MKPLLENFLAYNFWANLRLIGIFQAEYRHEASIRLFSHLLNAHDTWLARIRQQEPQFDIWEIHVVNSFERVNELNYQHSIRLLSEEHELGRIITYQNTSGKSFQNSISDILLHVVNHGTHHRAQIAGHMKKAGIDVPPIGYIVYKRES
jgi:uncharacterized damage-inducible protein DinB